MKNLFLTLILCLSCTFTYAEQTSSQIKPLNPTEQMINKYAFEKAKLNGYSEMFISISTDTKNDIKFNVYEKYENNGVIYLIGKSNKPEIRTICIDNEGRLFVMLKTNKKIYANQVHYYGNLLNDIQDLETTKKF